MDTELKTLRRENAMLRNELCDKNGWAREFKVDDANKLIGGIKRIAGELNIKIEPPESQLGTNWGAVLNLIYEWALHAKSWGNFYKDAARPSENAKIPEPHVHQPVGDVCLTCGEKLPDAVEQLSDMRVRYIGKAEAALIRSQVKDFIPTYNYDPIIQPLPYEIGCLGEFRYVLKEPTSDE